MTTLSLLVLLQALSMINGHRILGLFIHVGGSHYETFYPIMNGLAEKGHDVTVLSFFPKKNQYENYKEFIFDGIPAINSSLELSLFNPSRSMYTVYEEYFELHYWGVQSCNLTLFSTHIDTILDIHKKNPFDLVITELFNTDCMLGVIHKMSIPYIGISSCVLMPWHYNRISAPDTPSYISNEFLGYTEKMSFTQRLISWITTTTLKILYRITERQDNIFLKEKFGDGIPDVHEIGKKISLVFVNHHYSMYAPRPLPPQLVEIGGIHIKPEKPLPQNIQKILDNAEHGIIFISWGSNIKASSIEQDKLSAILKALGRLKQQVVWKWEDKKIVNKPKNVFISEWLPQRDILCHPKVKLFWGHGGNLGLSEAVHCGVPSLLTPIYGDQFFNAAAVKHRGMSVTLEYHDLNEESIYNKIMEAMDSNMVENAKVVSYSYRNRQKTPLETSLWWVEHVIGTGGNDLAKSHSVELSWFVYHSLDVILFLTTVFMIFFILICRILKKCCSRKEKRKVKKN